MMEAVQRPKLLCVDDEENILQSLERALKSRFDVLTSSRPADAIEILKGHPDCAVVLSDFRMPGMNGIDFLRQVRREHPLISRAVISGQIDLQQVSDAINAGEIHKFFLKPWENDYLLLQMTEAWQTHLTLKEKDHYQQLSLTDPITQLTNHRYFQEQLKARIHEASGSGKPLALLIFDVDHFKAFNDRFGHPEGDRLLFSVAQRLRQLAADRGMVSRYGGEEFTLILPDCGAPEALALAEKIRVTFERTPFTGPSSGPAYITLSGGLAMYPGNGVLPGVLIESADRALYQAKRQGRNQVVAARA
jgi:two-component system cell cycle response regulator